MILLPAETLPEGSGWTYELKLDGFRADRAQDRWRCSAPFPQRQGLQPEVSDDRETLTGLPGETVVNGEVVALDETGRPSFNALQNGAAGAAIVYYVFDVMILRGRNIILPKEQNCSHILRKCRQIP